MWLYATRVQVPEGVKIFFLDSLSLKLQNNMSANMLP